VKRLSPIAATLFLLCTLVPVQAAIVDCTYQFTGADLINNVFDATARYSADGSLKRYEGMRQIGPATGTAVGATFLSGSYLTNFNNAWSDAVNANRVLSAFLLSGMDGYAGQWGEDYKPYAWVSGTGPTGWVFDTQTVQKRTGAYTDQVPVWINETGGLSLTSADLATQVFSVTIRFDTDDMWWGNPNNYVYGCNTAPNSLNGLTMYFTSYFSQPGSTSYDNRYVGNMQAELVPEPMTMMLGAMGLGAVAGLRKLWRK